jgi:hypothetical protein
MFFPTSNHYFEKVEILDDCSLIDNVQYNEDNELIEDNECLICLEINDKTDAICIKIQNNFYKKDCLCDGWIHQYCLDFWYIQNKKCPICLCKMRKNDIDDIDDIVIRTHDSLITKIKTTLCLVFRYFLYMYLFINFMFFLYCVFS